MATQTLLQQDPKLAAILRHQVADVEPLRTRFEALVMAGPTKTSRTKANDASRLHRYTFEEAFIQWSQGSDHLLTWPYLSRSAASR